MRIELVPPRAGELTYEIRNIVNVADKLQKQGVRINWENIGDPVAKGEIIPSWMKEIVVKSIMDDSTWGYCHTRGVLETREYICDVTNRRGGARITPDDIIFLQWSGRCHCQGVWLSAWRCAGTDAITLLYHSYHG